MSHVVDPQECGFTYYREVGDGRYVAVVPRLYNGIVLIGNVTDVFGYTSHWCYQTEAAAIVAAHLWEPSEQPEPVGWFRHAATGRRRPDGDPAKEYVHV